MNTKKYTEEEARERRNARQREYDKRTNYAASIKSNAKNTKLFALRATISTDQDIIKKLESVESVSSYLKSLIRKDIEENGI